MIRAGLFLGLCLVVPFYAAAARVTPSPVVVVLVAIAVVVLVVGSCLHMAVVDTRDEATR